MWPVQSSKSQGAIWNKNICKVDKIWTLVAFLKLYYLNYSDVFMNCFFSISSYSGSIVFQMATLTGVMAIVLLIINLGCNSDLSQQWIILVLVAVLVWQKTSLDFGYELHNIECNI